MNRPVEQSQWPQPWQSQLNHLGRGKTHQNQRSPNKINPLSCALIAASLAESTRIGLPTAKSVSSAYNGITLDVNTPASNPTSSSWLALCNDAPLSHLVGPWVISCQKPADKCTNQRRRGSKPRQLHHTSFLVRKNLNASGVTAGASTTSPKCSHIRFASASSTVWLRATIRKAEWVAFGALTKPHPRLSLTATGLV